MPKKPKPRDVFIAKHTDVIVRVIAVALLLWFFSGLVLLDYLHPLVFLPLYVPFGLVAAYWANKW